ncbi:MAG: nuclear transport factor 2 family protein [Saprospiraceae bacterium]|nr:nuclear transport factor 2 family protein [Saprospiraceae bacterium]
MSTQEVADKLVQLCRTGQYQEAQSSLYGPSAVSIEPEGSPWGQVEGLEAIQAKAQQWGEMVEEVHSAQVSDPVVSGSHFACTMENDVTFKGMGRQQIKEVCVYEVQDGKIVKEQFFYDVAPPA